MAIFTAIDHHESLFDELSMVTILLEWCTLEAESFHRPWRLPQQCTWNDHWNWLCMRFFRHAKWMYLAHCLNDMQSHPSQWYYVDQNRRATFVSPDSWRSVETELVHRCRRWQFFSSLMNNCGYVKIVWSMPWRPSFQMQCSYYDVLVLNKFHSSVASWNECFNLSRFIPRQFGCWVTLGKLARSACKCRYIHVKRRPDLVLHHPLF